MTLKILIVSYYNSNFIVIFLKSKFYLHLKKKMLLFILRHPKTFSTAYTEKTSSKKWLNSSNER